jgi:hypothetical protein
MRVMDFTEEIRLDEGQNSYRAELQVATISGRVVDAAGTGIEGIRVSAESVSSGATTTRRVTASVMIMDDSDGGMGISTSTRDGRKPVMTDADGRFELRGVTPGKPIQVVAEGQELRTVRSDEITLSNGGLRSGVELTMVPGCQLTVKVVNEREEPVPYALVMLQLVVEGEDGGANTTKPGPNGTTDESGVLVFDTLDVGTYSGTATQLLDDAQLESPAVQATTSLKNPQEMVLHLD